MPDVGILNLQIHDDSSKAAEGLGRLATALGRVKSAIGSGLKLAPIANQIKKLNESLKEAIPESSISSLERFANAVEKINAAGGVKLKGMKGMADAFNMDGVAGQMKEQVDKGSEGAFRSLKNEIQETKDQIENGVGGALIIVENRIRATGEQVGGMRAQMEELNQLVQQTAMSAGSMAEQFSKAFQMWNSIRMAGAIGGGNTNGLPGGTEVGWNTWKEGAIEAEYTISEATDETFNGINQRIEGSKQLLLEAGAAMRDVVEQSTSGTADMSEQFGQMFGAWNDARMTRALGSGSQVPLLGSGSEAPIVVEYRISDATEETFDNIDRRIEGSKQLLLEAGETAIKPIEETEDAVEEMADKLEKATSDIIGYKRVWDDNSRQWESVGYTQEEWDSRLAAVAGMNSAMNSGVDTANVDRSLEKTGSVADDVKERFKDLSSAAKEFGKEGASGIKSMLTPLMNLAKQFMKIARYRAMRAVLKSITEGFKEGVENYYRYSQAVGTSFAPAMDSAASSLLQMKNSIGAAVAPLIQSLIPYLQMAVNWFITAVNYANQFFALLRGQSTWSKATEQNAKAFDDVKKSAGGASKAMKDLLADWDELNIIQSESGGGGGSGRSGKKALDYAGMFEEVGQFDERIKSVVSFLKDNFATIFATVQLIRKAIKGWKIGKYFDKDNVIGQLAKIVAGGAIIALSVKLGYESGFSAGEKGFFDTGDILGTIASAIAGGIGGYIISGSASGIAIGVGIALIGTLTGYIEGRRSAKDALKWGSNSLTPDEIKRYVRSQFSFDIEARIQVLDSIIENQETAKRRLNEKIDSFNEALSKIHIGVDGSEKAITEAATAAGNVIEQIQTNLKNSEKNLEVLTKITPITDDSGNDKTQDFLSSVKIADKRLSDYFTDIGKKIAHLVDEGEKSGWKNNEAEMALELMQHQQAIFDKAEQNKINREFQVDAELNLSSMTRDNVEEVLKQQTELIEQTREKTKTAYENQVKELFYYADLADAAGVTDEEGNPLSETFKARAEELLEQIKNGSIYSELDKDVAKLREQWIEQLRKVYGEDFDKELGDIFDDNDIFGNFEKFLGLGSSFERGVSTANFLKGPEGVAEYLEAEIRQLLKRVDVKGITEKAMDEYGFNLFDLLSEGTIANLAGRLRSGTGNDEDAIEILKALGLSDEAISKAMEQARATAESKAKEVKESVETETSEISILGVQTEGGWWKNAWDKVFGGAEAESEAEAAGEKWKDVLSAMWDADWNTMADEELMNLIAALREKFGSNAVDQALSELDIPAADLTVPLNTTLDETVDAGDVSILGISTEGGWWNNLFNGLFGGGPMETDATVHVGVDMSDEDASVLDTITNGKIATTGQIERKAGANAGVRFADGTGNGEGTIAVTVDNTEQRGNIQTGVQLGTGQLLAALNRLNEVAEAINRKNFTVSITPSAPLGRNIRTAGGMFDTVTGAVR